MKNKETELIHVGRKKRFTGKAVNPHLVRASTIIFDSVQDLAQSGKRRSESVEYYGRRGTQTTFAFQEAMCELENAAGCFVYPSGTSAITASLLSFLDQGDHLLMVDSVYEPTRDFCSGTLADKGVEVSFYDPCDNASLAERIKDNTRVIFLESPGSLTMEMQDIEGVVEIAKAHDIVTIIDNTYASPYQYRPLEHGIDVCIHSATKYICGHADVMLGVASANQQHWPQLQKISAQLGLCASVDDIYTAMRGLRTMAVRMEQHDKNARIVANWLVAREEVASLRHPAYPSCPGHEYFERDFDGGNGLFSFVLKQSTPKAVAAMLDGFTHFKIGFSYGGFESLVLAASQWSSREFCTVKQGETLIRLHIGLENVNDLIEDLDAGFERFNRNL
ncbi:MAG: cystathionine beta-lyase [Pseudomonadota bacterium]